MALQSKESIVSRMTEALLFSGALWFAFAICVPWMPDFSVTGLDPSWRLSLHYFYEHGYVYGKDIIFTYGPYGFISTYTYYPATYRILVFAYLFFAAVYTAAGWDILRNVIRHKGLLFLAILAATLFLAPAPNNNGTGDTFFYPAGILFFVSYLMERDKPFGMRNFFLVGVLAAASLMKYSFFIGSVSLLFFVSLDGMLFKKKAPFLLFLYCGILAGLWVLAKQPLAALGPFLLAEANLAHYYGATMSYPLTVYYARFVFYIVIFVLFLAVFLIAQWRRTGRQALLPSLTLAAMGFLIFRAAFTRPDHSGVAMSYVAILGIYLIPFLNEVLKTRWWKFFLALLLTLVLTLGYTYGLKPLDPSFLKFTTRIGNSIAKMPHYVFVESRFSPQPKDLQEIYGIIGNAVRQLNPVPQLYGTVDIYPTDSTGLIAKGLQYKPRPVFQSYSAYSPFLSKKNADFLKSPGAPEFLALGSNITGDGKPFAVRYPTLDDSLSFPEIRSRYDFVSVFRGNALLKKARFPRPYFFQPIGKVTAEFGEPVPVPRFDQGPIWVEMDIGSTWRGKMFEFLGRAGRTEIIVKARNGMAYTYTLPPAMSPTGFLLSPVLDNAVGFIAFWTRHEDPVLFHKEVVELRLEVPAAFQGFFKPKFEARFFELRE